MKKISCIIPAYNEEKGIGDVLFVVVPLIGKYLHEVIVVDDGSSDKTKQIVKSFSGADYIEHPKNMGKSKTIADGIRAAKGDFIFMLDADLKFLNEKNIRDILYPIEQNISDVSISMRKNSWPLFPFKKIDYLSGERILPRFCFMEKIAEMELLPSYGLEVFLNKIIIKNKLSITVVEWKNVENNFSQDKRGIWKGSRVILGVWSDILCTISIFEMYYQNIKLIQLIKKNKNINPKISLVIPAFNEEKYIGACLDSVIKNSQGIFFELIVVDNASTDNTKKVAEGFSEVRVVYEGDKGLTKARQRGLDASKGDYVAYIDADTVMPENWSEILLDLINKDKRAVAFSGPYVYQNVSSLKKYIVWVYWNVLARISYFFTGYMMVGGNFVVKRDAILKIGGFNKNISFYGEDTDIARRLSKVGRIIFKRRFYILTSDRRFEGEGFVSTGWKYIINFLAISLRGKPFTNNYKDIR